MICIRMCVCKKAHTIAIIILATCEVYDTMVTVGRWDLKLAIVEAPMAYGAVA